MAKPWPTVKSILLVPVLYKWVLGSSSLVALLLYFMDWTLVAVLLAKVAFYGIGRYVYVRSNPGGNRVFLKNLGIGPGRFIGILFIADALLSTALYLPFLTLS